MLETLIRQCVACVLALLPAALLAAPILVTDLEGEVQRGQQSLSLLATLAKNDQLALLPGAKAVVTYLPQAREYLLRGPGSYLVGVNEVLPLKGAVAPEVRELPAAYRNIRVDTAQLAQAGVRLRGDNAAAALAPSGLVADAPREFSWPTVAGAEGYVFRLADKNRDLVFEARVAEPACTLPRSVQLKPGARYFWGIEAPGSDQEPHWTRLHVARDASSARRLKDAKPAEDAPRSERILFAIATETTFSD